MQTKQSKPITVKLNDILSTLLLHAMTLGTASLFEMNEAYYVVIKRLWGTALGLLVTSTCFGMFIHILQSRWKDMPALTFLRLKVIFLGMLYLSPAVLFMAGFTQRLPITTLLALLLWLALTGRDLLKAIPIFKAQLQHHTKTNILRGAFSLPQHAVYDTPLILFDERETDKRLENFSERYQPLIHLSGIFLGLLVSSMEGFERMFLMSILCFCLWGFVFDDLLARTLALLLYLEKKQKDDQQPFVIRKDCA